jgi:hypothetical protein
MDGINNLLSTKLFRSPSDSHTLATWMVLPESSNAAAAAAAAAAADYYGH